MFVLTYTGCVRLREYMCVLYIISLIMGHILLWRHIVLLTVGVYSSNNGVLYIVGISMTRRFKKSVGPSVSLPVRL